MFHEFSQTAAEYGSYYYQSLWAAWKHIGPMQYVGLLIAVLVIGWMMMKGSAR